MPLQIFFFPPFFKNLPLVKNLKETFFKKLEILNNNKKIPHISNPLAKKPK